jgi:hypothetical protein
MRLQGRSSKKLPAQKRTVPACLLACVAIVIACLAAMGMLVSQRDFARMFYEFEVKLPLALIACSPVLPLGLLAIALGAVFVSLNSQYHRFANRWNGMLIVCTVIALAVYAWGIFWPLIQLISGLSE